MKSVGIADLKAHLSEHLRSVRKGGTLLVVDRGTPVARIVPASEPHAGVVVRPAIRDLHSVKQLRPLALAVDSLSLLLEDRKR